MRPLSLLLVVLLWSLPLSGCSPAVSRDDFAYADAPFSLSVEGTYLPAADYDGIPRPISATVTAGTPLNGDPTLRDLTVTFTAPATLAGVTVTALVPPSPDDQHPNSTVARTVTFSYPSDYGRIEVTAVGDEFKGFLRFAEALLPMGDTVAVSPVGEDGGYTVTRRTGDGGREAEFGFVADGEYPQKVKVTDALGSMELTVTPCP